MKTHTLKLVILAAALSSCQPGQSLPQAITGGVPEMPYRPRSTPYRYQPPVQQPQQQSAASWESAERPSPYISSASAAADPYSSSLPPIPDPAPPVGQATAPVQPVSQAAASAPIAEPKSLAPVAVKPVAPEPIAPDPQVPAIKPLDMNSLSGTLPAAAAAPAKGQTDIPVATRVPGDPMRVWNPLDPSKKIRIVNPKTNQPFESGRRLKVRAKDGTDFFFIVP